MKHAFGQYISNLFRRRNRPEANDKSMPPKTAQKIQKHHYIKGRQTAQDRLTPPYLIIAAGLESSEDQIFEATVTALCGIARERPCYKEDILRIFQTYEQEHPEQKDRLKIIHDFKV
jgi:hypothetical protein